MKRKEIIQVATKIMSLEKEGTAEALKEMEKIANSLTLEDMLAIDDYIMRENF